MIYNMTVEVKICGLDRPETVDGAVNAGAEMLGFVFYPPSQELIFLLKKLS